MTIYVNNRFGALYVVTNTSAPNKHFIGWSFPSRQEQNNPIRNYILHGTPPQPPIVPHNIALQNARQTTQQMQFPPNTTRSMYEFIFGLNQNRSTRAQEDVIQTEIHTEYAMPMNPEYRTAPTELQHFNSSTNQVPFPSSYPPPSYEYHRV